MSELSVLDFLLLVSFFSIVAVPLYQYVKRGGPDLFEPVYLATFLFLASSGFYPSMPIMFGLRLSAKGL
jgi:hypothetical protein